MKGKQVKTIQISIEDLDEKVLKHELLDVQDWVQKAVEGKINSVKTRLLKEAQEQLFKDPEVESMPASESGCLELYFSRSYYKDRAARESE